jgi:hypothetical protein
MALSTQKIVQASSRMWAHYLIPLLMTIAVVSSLSPQSKWIAQKSATESITSSFVSPSDNHHHGEPSRRAFLVAGLAAAVAFKATPSYAMAMVTPDEFNIILRDSSRGITRVEFSGPKSEVITVRLVDGTSFGIKDVVESSTDPRSPLKISAACRENRVLTRFVDIESILATTPRKKKMYMNTRVAEAAVKEKEKRARMQQDEEDRLAALYKMAQ